MHKGCLLFPSSPHLSLKEPVPSPQHRGMDQLISFPRIWNSKNLKTTRPHLTDKYTEESVCWKNEAVTYREAQMRKEKGTESRHSKELNCFPVSRKCKCTPIIGFLKSLLCVSNKHHCVWALLGELLFCAITAPLLLRYRSITRQGKLHLLIHSPKDSTNINTLFSLLQKIQLMYGLRATCIPIFKWGKLMTQRSKMSKVMLNVCRGRAGNRISGFLFPGAWTNP